MGVSWGNRMKWGRGWAAVSAIVFCLTVADLAKAQDNYEIQVYGADTVDPGYTMAELHNNFTFEGSKTSQDGMFPTNHQWHETTKSRMDSMTIRGGILHFHRRAKWPRMGLVGVTTSGCACACRRSGTARA